MGEQSILAVLKKAIELCMPDFRHYYRMTLKAKIVASYASDGRYYADVQPLRNDETPDEKEPVIPQVEIPVYWGGPSRGIICPPTTGTLCDLSYYDGDPNYPRISNFRWQGNGSPKCGLDELVIQQTPEVSITIQKDGSFLTVSPKDWTVKIGGNATIEASGTITLRAPEMHREGNETCTGTGGGIGRTEEHAHRTTYGSITLQGPLKVTGDVGVSGNLSVAGNVNCSGTSYAAGRSGASI